MTSYVHHPMTTTYGKESDLYSATYPEPNWVKGVSLMSDEELLVQQLEEWVEIEETYDEHDVIIDAEEMEEVGHEFQVNGDYRENRLSLQASAAMVGGEYMVPRQDITWSTEQYTGSEFSWEDEAMKRATLDPVFIGSVVQPELRDPFVDPASLGGLGEHNRLDAGDRIIVFATITHLGENYHTATSVYGKIYINLKFTPHLVADQYGFVKMIIRLKEADRHCPWACVRVIKE